MIKQAIIPLAGLGTRLLPLTSVFAKELLPINGKPGIEYILEECIDAGVKEIIFIINTPLYLNLVLFLLRPPPFHNNVPFLFLCLFHLTLS